MNNSQFLQAVQESFKRFLSSGSRSTDKLKPLHGAIAKDLAERLGREYRIESQGYGNDKEGSIAGRYMDKKVDITISKGNRPICGVAVKFVMQNYSQNSNNYFENMLGETANIRSAACPYFQIFIIIDRHPYYENGGSIKHWEEFTANHMHKYVVIDKDDASLYYHAPNKILMYVVRLPEVQFVKTRSEYNEKYKQLVKSCEDRGIPLFSTVGVSDNVGSLVIVNDYESFANKVYHTIMAS